MSSPPNAKSRHFKITSISHVSLGKWPRTADIVAWLSAQEPGVQEVARLFPVRTRARINNHLYWVVGYENTGDETEYKNALLKMSPHDPRKDFERSLSEYISVPWQAVAEVAEAEGTIRKSSGIIVPPGSDDPRLVH